MLGLQHWWLKSKVIAEGSVNQAAEGKHYSRAIHLHNESLNCLLRFQSEKIIVDLPVDVMKKVKNIRLHPSPDSLNDLLSTSQWEEIKKNLLNTSGTMGKWILQYITKVNALLSQITAYREKYIELHLQAQRGLLPLMFALNHQNFSRYLTNYHVELTNLPLKNLSAYKDLQAYGIGATISIPRDLVTEATINREVKVHGGPMRGGYSTSFDAENDFVLNSLILAELRKELKSKMSLKTASTHKEAIYGEMQRHKEQIQSL